MSNQWIRRLIAGCVLAFGSFAAQADSSCAFCPEAQVLESRMDQLPADPLNEETIEAQDALMWDTSKLLYKNLQRPSLNLDEATALIRLASRILDYDNAMMTVVDNIENFRRHYERDGELSFKSVLARMRAEGLLTGDEKHQLLESYGLLSDSEPEN